MKRIIVSTLFLLFMGGVCLYAQTVADTLNLYNGVNIIVENGGCLIVDGGTIENASITLRSGSKIIITNSGTVNMAPEAEFDVPAGAIAEIVSGTVN